MRQLAVPLTMGRLGVLTWLMAGVVGSLAFWLFQRLTTGFTIPQYIGEQVATQGGYPIAWAPLIGWAVHLGVSLAYSFLFAALMALLAATSSGPRLGIGIILVLVLGWVTTLATAPAITATVSILSGQGFPAELPGLNTDVDLPLYNHILFFGVVWVFTALVPVLRRRS
jgi:hypothetical protein